MVSKNTTIQGKRRDNIRIKKLHEKQLKRAHIIKEALDNNNIDEIERLSITFDKIDIHFELYNNDLLSSERLQFIMKNCTKYFNISSNFINQLIKDNNITLLDIIFS